MILSVVARSDHNGQLTVTIDPATGELAAPDAVDVTGFKSK